MLFTPIFIMVVVYLCFFGVKVLGATMSSAGTSNATKPSSCGIHDEASHAADQVGNNVVSMEEHLALKAEVERMKQVLNKYESVWGWERPFPMNGKKYRY